MNKERKVTQPNAVVVFNRDVRASELNALPKDFHGDVIVSRDLILDEHLHVKCTLYVLESIIRIRKGASEYNITIEGDLYCYCGIDCYNIYVQGLLYCEGKIDATNIEVIENLCCNDSIEAYSYSIIVAGDLECLGIEAENVHALGKIDIKGSISIDYSIKSGY